MVIRILLVLVLAVSGAWGATYYIDITNGNDGIASAADYALTSATKTVTKAGAFAAANYTFHAGDQIQITTTGAGGHAVAGFYTIASKTDNTLVLATDPTDGTDETSVSLVVGNTGTAAATSVGAITGPWKTIVKAVATVAAGDEVVVADGTYAENSGSNYLSIGSKTYATPVTFRADNPHVGTTWNVIITGASGNNNVYIDSCTGITFKEIEFQPNSNSSDTVYLAGANKRLRFINCNLTNSSVTSGRRTLYMIGTSAGYTIEFIGCSFFGKSDKAVISSINAASLPVLDNIMFQNCTIASTGGTNTPLVDIQKGFSGLLFDTCVFTHTGTSNVKTITLGIDGASDNASSCAGIKLKDCTISTSTSSHALIVGGNVHGLTVDGCGITATSADYGIVIKCATGASVRNNTVVGATAGLISRASYGFEINNNVFYADTSGITIEDYDGSTPDYGTGDLGEVYNNICYITGAGDQYGLTLFDSAGATNCYVDYNCYYGTGTFYPLRVDGANKTQAEALAFWPTYGTETGRTTNDVHSVFADPQFTNIATGDYTPRNSSLKTPDNTWMGAVQPKSSSSSRFGGGRFSN